MPSSEPSPRPPADEPVVQLRGVGHTFGTNEALRDLDLLVPRGRITVLLGPNGAGKTTTARVVTGALLPDTGTVRTLGHDPGPEGHLVRPRCGVVSAKPALYDRLSGRDNLEYAAELYGVDSRMEQRIAEAAGRFGITGALDDLVGGYSTGMKTRLALARSILHEPELLLFDEPTSGLDPESSAAVLSYIRAMTDEGRTVVMCTHLLSEAEGLADHVVIMDGGTDLISGSPHELTRRWWPHPLVTIAAQDPRLLERMRGWDGVLALRNGPGGARVELDDIARVPDLVAALVRDGVALTRVEPHRPTLEDLYFGIRGRLSRSAREAGLEVDGVLDPVAVDDLGHDSTASPVMPTLEVPDGLHGLAGPGGPGGPGAERAGPFDGRHATPTSSSEEAQ